MKDKIKNLEEKSLHARRLIIESLYKTQSGHPGPSLSVTDLVTSLFFEEMNFGVPTKNVIRHSKTGERPTFEPAPTERDIFILSKGHAAPALYAALAVGDFIPEKELVDTLREVDSRLEGHPVRTALPEYIDFSTGSLGQGLSGAIGYSLAAKLQGLDRRTYVIIGDGESQEGQVWEAAMSASTFAREGKLGHLLAITDYNQFQNDGASTRLLPREQLPKMWEAFGWNVIEADGHNYRDLLDAYKIAREVTDKPTMIIADTVKGKGVSFMENTMSWHAKKIGDTDYKKAMTELGGYQ